MRILAFGDIHFHTTHKFSTITNEGFTIRELEHLSCAKRIKEIYAAENIDKVVFLGDMFGPVGDSMSCQTLAAVTEFLNQLSDIKVDLLVGNHDISGYLDTKYVHKLIPFKNWKNIMVYDTPLVKDNFVYMPFCNSDEYAEAFLEAIPDKENKIVFSHLELSGINLGNGIFTKKGVKLETLEKFKMTLQGHYHTGNSYAKNIYVAGSTQRLSFKDPGKSRKNILIYDTDTNTIKRESFNCPDWLMFNDDNIDDLLTISNDNYVRLDISSDILLTPEIKEKLECVKGKDIHIDITRLSVSKHIAEEQTEAVDEATIISQFINKSENTPEQKEALIKEGLSLLGRANV